MIAKDKVAETERPNRDCYTIVLRTFENSGQSRQNASTEAIGGEKKIHFVCTHNEVIRFIRHRKIGFIDSFCLFVIL